jgi:molybdate transport system regulatory protein
MKLMSESFHIRSKVWIEDNEGNVIFGLGRLKMLETIQRLGSIQAAAKELKMSYRAIWGRIKATEDRLGEQLLVRNIGGSSGGGSELTLFARMLMEQFRQIHKLTVSESDKLFENIFSRR